MQPGLFSFLGDEFEAIVNRSALFLPGIERITAVYYSAGRQQIRVISRDTSLELTVEDAIVSDPEIRAMVQKFRQLTRQISWINKDELPFKIPAGKAIIGSLFSELDHVNLVLRYESPRDHLQDCLIVQFNKNLGNFSVNKADKILSTENKAIIGYLLYHQFNSFLTMSRENQAVLKKLNNSIRGVIRENDALKTQLRQFRMAHSESLVNLARQHLQELEAASGKAYGLSDDAVEKIREFKGNLKHLPQLLENAVLFTENLLMPGDDQPVTLHASSLDFDSYQLGAQEEGPVKTIDIRHSRAMQILDKLEKAAIALLSRNLTLTGANVARNMDPPITAPAITDALEKNNVSIRHMLDKYPDKWENIRKDFRPLHNMLRKNRDGSELEEASA